MIICISIIDNYIPEILKFRWYYGLGLDSVAAAAAATRRFSVIQKDRRQPLWTKFQKK